MKLLITTFLCLIALMAGSQSCVIEQSYEVTWRSIGTGDEQLYAGEHITLCYSIESYTAVGNNCQWLQGVVPRFGDGWDMTEFDPVGEATLAGNSFPADGLYTGTWDWFDDVTYHHDHKHLHTGPFGSEGALGLCDSRYEDCGLGQIVTGGCCPNCWMDQPGDTLPGGWFAFGTTGNCPINGHPTQDWGDGAGCGDMTEPWIICMELTVKEDIVPGADLSVAFFTFGDGETGAWNGGPSVCADDKPLYIYFPTSETPKDSYYDEVTDQDIEVGFPGMGSGSGGIDLNTRPVRKKPLPYPNPTTGKVYYKGEERDLTDYPAGVYLIEIGGEVHRIVKQ